MNLTPKYKSDVQLNGYKKPNMDWVNLFTSNLNYEFKDRYDDIIKKYEELKDEIYWNTIIYNLDIRFKPVIGNIYYLYIDNEKYFLSIISPSEWSKEFISEFRFDYNGKWNKI
jgi:hypothetical protein